MPTKSPGWLLAVSMALIMGTASSSFAQTSAASGSQGNAPAITSSGGGPAPTVITGTGQEIAPTGQYQEGIAVGGWMLFPEIFVGAVYNTNPDQLADGGNKGT